MARDHGFHPVRITRIVEETPDVRTFALDTWFPYQAGQFVTVRACGTLRSYSMSSSPDVDDELCVTVKRVPGGVVSSWMHEELRAGDTLEATLPSGSFCLRENATPVVAFAGGSGITPVFSLVKSALATTGREVRVLTANQDADSVIFRDALDSLAHRHPDRFRLHHHLDDRQGLVSADEIRAVAAGALDGDFYVCGPEPYMALVRGELAGLGIPDERLLVERFTPVGAPSAPAPETDRVRQEGTVTIRLRGDQRTVPQRAGETLIQTARRAGFTPPFSCEAGDCATCMARITEGEAKMRVNNALDEDEVAEGWVLTCQGEPITPQVCVVYDD
ncbi:ferredoxin--NADP reductase [Streptomyces flaveus]|uniref:Ferredoxin n=1 Tax=Streptomyces flaveus TaxID=66370 RepID=A0A917QN05_9ACTN|nr:ferredoxin--NADP reductase [Streptomyces flaveus]GGK59363.1 ferredoxin [Streptomyces flaveus]